MGHLSPVCLRVKGIWGVRDEYRGDRDVTTVAEISEQFRKRAIQDATSALGISTSAEPEPPRVLTEEVLIRSHMLLSDGFADALDSRYGSRLVVFHPNTVLTFDVRHWLWRRAARGDATLISRWVPEGEFYSTDIGR